MPHLSSSSECFYTPERAENAFPQPPPMQFCWVLCPEYAQEETAFTHFQPLAQGTELLFTLRSNTVTHTEPTKQTQ